MSAENCKQELPIEEASHGDPSSKDEDSPAPKTRTLHPELTLGEAKTQLDLPPAGISDNQSPSIIAVMNGLVGQ
jgi:hypothetical protein